MIKEYPFAKIVQQTKPKPGAREQYTSEITTLGPQGLADMFERGKRWSKTITSCLLKGGGAIFPHTYISKCGDQIAAVITAILDSGADNVILLGTAHSFPDTLGARVKEFRKEDVITEPCRGLLDQTSDCGQQFIKDEFSLTLFKKLFEIEVQRRGIKSPTLIERYPCLTAGHPETLPGIEELQALSANAVIVGTDDYCHHGIAYCVPHEAAIPLGEEAQIFAHEQVFKGYAILQEGRYVDYFDHWMNPYALGDPSDVTVVIRYLIGEKATAEILDLKIVDVSPLFEGDPSPSWVAATLGILSPQ